MLKVALFKSGSFNAIVVNTQNGEVDVLIIPLLSSLNECRYALEVLVIPEVIDNGRKKQVKVKVIKKAHFNVDNLIMRLQSGSLVSVLRNLQMLERNGVQICSHNLAFRKSSGSWKVNRAKLFTFKSIVGDSVVIIDGVLEVEYDYSSNPPKFSLTTTSSNLENARSPKINKEKHLLAEITTTTDDSATIIFSVLNVL